MNKERIIGSYRVTHQIGVGGMGAVYAAQHTVLGRPAAIKLLLPEHLGNEQLAKRFINEAKAAAAIRHPGIVEIYDFGRHQGGGLFIAMELLQGEDLAQRLDRGVRFSIKQSVLFAVQACGVLEEAHRSGITHRDLKPANIFIVSDPQVSGGERIKLLDFGIAKFAVAGEGGVAMTRAGAIMGTPKYMPPEQCLDSSKVDHRSDIYSLGCILYEMLCSRAPFVSQNDNVFDIMTMQIHDTPPNLSSLRTDIPTALDTIVLKALEKEREHRFQSAGEFGAALLSAVGNIELDEGWLDASLGVASPNTTMRGAAGAMLSPPPRRSRKSIPIAITIAVCLGAGSFLYLNSQKNSSDSVQEQPPHTVGPSDISLPPPPPPPPPRFIQLKSNDAAPEKGSDEVFWLLRSKPKGAEVRYKDKPVGHTATNLVAQVKSEPTRTERLIFRKEGYVDHTLDLATDQAYTDVVLLRARVSVAIRSKPSSAQVYLQADDEYQGNTPLELDHASGAKITVVVKLEGYKDEVRTIDFTSNHGEMIKLDKLDLVKVRIESDPSGAEVWLGDTRLGTTPYSDTFDRQKSKRVFRLQQEGCKDAKVRLFGRRDDAKMVELTCE